MVIVSSAITITGNPLTMLFTVGTLQPRISSTSVVGTIGYPLDTVSAFIVTPVSRREGTNTIQVLPIGEVGELAVGGHQIADRYLNRPELTAASFINDADYGCLYRTGDRARMHHDGTLECLGRVAVGQVKIRGQRVELGEVEQTLRKTDGCRAVKALVIDQVLVAFCATGSLKLSRAAVLDTCKRWLPGYMTPSSVCFVRSMPQLPSGKIDTQSLETLYKTTRYSAGSTKTGVHDFASHVVLGVLTRHLREAVTLDSELARNGLDSLQAIRVASALRVEGSHLTTMDVLSATTARDLTEVFRDTPLKKELGESRTEILDSMHLQTPEFGPRSNNSARTIPCTPLQEALLAETINNPTAYCNWVEIQLAETYTFDEIRNAVKALAASNEVLRSGFCPTHAQKTPMDGLDESRRDGRASASFNQIVWTDLDDSQIQHVSAFSRPYSLGSYESLLHPLSVQIQTISDQPRLLFRMHHALYDGWSIDLMLQDLEDILHGRPAIQRLQFQEVVRYYIGHETTIRAAAEQYWADHLRDRASTSLPNYNGRVVTGRSSQPLKSRSSVSLPMLLGRARDLGVNPQVFFQAATAYVMSLYIGSDDVVIGNVTSGRTIPVTGIEDIVGPCIASLPFRLRLEHLPYVRDILYETQRLNRESLQHCSLPLRNIAKVAQTEHGSSLFDVLFIWQQSLSSKPDSSLVAHVVDSADELQFKITIEYEPGREYVSSRATYDLSTVPEKQIHHLLRQIDEVVEVFMTDEGCKTSEIAKHFGTSTQSIANSTPRQNLPLFGLSHAVEDWAIRTPDKDAIVFGQVCNSVMKITGTITYAALNRYANQLARYLSHQGNSKDQLIAIIMDTSIDLYVAVLAVLKTGSGYLPLAPDTPVQRVRTILEDAKVTFCITDCSTSAQFRQHLPVKIIDMSKVDLSPHTDRNLNTPYNGACLAYAVFTSGSTGTPKGVLVTQENLMSNIEYLSGIYPHSASSRLLQSSSQAFDLSVFEIFFSWHVGITLCTAKKDDLFYNLEGAISQLGVTHLSLTPTVAALIDPDHVPKVDFLVTAGEAVTEHVKRKWADRGILFQGKLISRSA
jgi:non-ribosomal peptide synthetase component F/aryl carrier-like protein